MNFGELRRLLVAARESGPRATVIAGEAKRRGAKQKIREFAGLVRLVRRQRPSVVLEIGSLKGGSLWAWCRLARQDATIISVDLPGGDFGGGYLDTETPKLRGYAKRGQTVHLVRGDSHSADTLDEVRRLLDGRVVDFLFIDGDHTYEGVRLDYEMYGPLGGDGGVIAFHDILTHTGDTACQVDRLWTELRQNELQHLEFNDAADVKWNGVWGGIGVLLR